MTNEASLIQRQGLTCEQRLMALATARLLSRSTGWQSIDAITMGTYHMLIFTHSNTPNIITETIG
jgi:hypothetical protein